VAELGAGARLYLFWRLDLEITGGNAEVAEKKGIAEKATRKLMKGKKLEIDRGTEAQFADQKVGIMGVTCGRCCSETT
jgi:hypothetical protein